MDVGLNPGLHAYQADTLPTGPHPLSSRNPLTENTGKGWNEEGAAAHQLQEKGFVCFWTFALWPAPPDP